MTESTPARPAKVQRWMDLLAALLRRRSPATFAQLREDVPAYYDPEAKPDSIMRTFERDKDELRELGIAIESVADEDGNLTSYQLKSRNFYLPYVQVPDAAGRKAAPNRPKTGMGYQSLPLLTFTPDQLAMVIRAARRVQQMGHPGLAADADSAMRKLAHDVSLGGDEPRELSLPTPGQADAQALERLDDAIRRRKSVTFEYFSINRDSTGAREVHPYGLLFISSVWYLVAFDPSAEAIRNFRVSRITRLKINDKRAQSADFDVPSDLDLWARAESRRAWELGDEDAITVTVRFTIVDAYSAAGAELGAENSDGTRTFSVRRSEPFVRWLLSFGGAAEPVTPPEIVQAWRELADRTLALYGGDA